MKVLLLKDPKDKDSGPDPYVKVSKLNKSKQLCHFTIVCYHSVC